MSKQKQHQQSKGFIASNWYKNLKNNCKKVAGAWLHNNTWFFIKCSFGLTFLLVKYDKAKCSLDLKAKSLTVSP